MAHIWKIGDWVEWNGKRWYVFNVLPGNEMRVIDRYGSMIRVLNSAEDHKHLPDCTGWEWEPKPTLEPPKGYRLLSAGEAILTSDLWLNEKYYWDELSRAACIGDKWNTVDHRPMARKLEPKYRPFANAAEFKQHRDKWIVRKDGKPGAHRSGTYGDSGSIFSFKRMFDSFVFEDGTPCGVLETSE